jgi:uncharacterized membrane protein YgcG
VQVTNEGAARRFRIGNPNRTISGKQSYRIQYTIGGALNGFASHDELYWNATGVWPVPMQSASITVSAPDSAIQRVDCFQGRAGSTEKCASSIRNGEAHFSATRPLNAGEQLTIVTAIRKGVVPEPRPILSARPSRGAGSAPREIPPWMPPVAVALFAIIAFALFRLWMQIGRDRRYVSLHRSADANATEEVVPLFGARPVAVEFKAPDQLRPGQVGLLIDETVDTLDVTATIIDLAVRGHLRISELPAKGWFGSRDWELHRLKEDTGELLPYERLVMLGLFNTGSYRKLSDLKEKFYKDLAKVKESLYEDAVARRWFPSNPSSVRAAWLLAGLLSAAAGVGLAIFLQAQFGAGLLGAPIAGGGVVIALISGAVARRTALGRDLMMRSLGFAKYIRTGELHQLDYAERANIFTENLPYAIVFKCVDRWAKAFRDIDIQAATASWYVGAAHFDIGNFSSSLTTFSSTVGSTVASTPGSSGSSGFGGGGSSGGGGGGGGGGSW